MKGQWPKSCVISFYHIYHGIIGLWYLQNRVFVLSVWWDVCSVPLPWGTPAIIRNSAVINSEFFMVNRLLDRYNSNAYCSIWKTKYYKFCIIDLYSKPWRTHVVRQEIFHINTSWNRISLLFHKKFGWLVLQKHVFHENQSGVRVSFYLPITIRWSFLDYDAWRQLQIIS